MNNILNQIYLNHCKDTTEDEKIIKNKILQEIILSGLSRTEFFRQCALCGDSAISIFYEKESFSESLKFSLICTNSNFEINEFLKAIENEFESLGFEVVTENVSNANINITLVELEIKMNFNIFDSSDKLSHCNINSGEILKIEFEIDLNSSQFAKYEVKFGLEPWPYHVKMYDFSTLFADKIEMLLCKNVTDANIFKELCDYACCFNFGEEVNFKYLKERLIKNKIINEDSNFTIDELKRRLIQKFEIINYENLQNSFIEYDKTYEKFEQLNKEYFIELTKRIKES